MTHYTTPDATPSSPAPDKITVVRDYQSAVNAVIESEQYVAMTRYFIRRWSPILGGVGVQIVMALRSLGYYNPRTNERREGIEIDLPALAEMIGVHDSTISREFGPKIAKGKKVPGQLQNPALHQFVRREPQFRTDPVTGHILKTTTVYKIKMDDPLHEDDLPKLQEALDAQEKDASREPQNAAYGYAKPSRRKPQNAALDTHNAKPEQQNASPKPQNASREPQNAASLIDYSVLPENTQTTLNTKEQEAQKIERAENTENTGGLAPEAPAVPVVIVKTGWNALTEAERLPYLERAETAFKGNMVYLRARHPERLLIPKAKELYDIDQKGGTA